MSFLSVSHLSAELYIVGVWQMTTFTQVCFQPNDNNPMDSNCSLFSSAVQCVCILHPASAPYHSSSGYCLCGFIGSPTGFSSIFSPPKYMQAGERSTLNWP